MNNPKLPNIVQNWTPVDLAYKGGGSNRHLGDYNLSQDGYEAKTVITKTLGDDKYQFSEEDRVLLYTICSLDAIPAKARDNRQNVLVF